MRFVFIVNPVAGNSQAMQTLAEPIKKLCESRNIEYTIHVTQHPRHACELARAEAETGEELRIFACGGDGTLCETANGVIGCPNVELGCIPLGSGNDYIKTFADKEHFLELEAYIFAPSVEVDAIRAGDTYSINICSLGLDAIVCDKASQYIRAGKYNGSKAYDKALANSLFGKRSNKLKVTIDDNETFEGDYLFSLAANGICYGGGYYGAPKADPSDGALDFVLIKAVPLVKIPFLVGEYKQGSFIKSRKFKKILNYRRGKKMHITAEEPAIVNIDGECTTLNEITFEIVAKALRFIVPTTYVEKKDL